MTSTLMDLIAILGILATYAAIGIGAALCVTAAWIKWGPKR
ncbi:hypothetical protein [Brachybacterium sp. UMB0905]|nr:hypothetical protein [Brachybacterium sp. UMB0905]